MRIPRRKPVYPFGDNDALYFGTSSDVAMYWDGTQFIMDSAGDIRLDATGDTYFFDTGTQALKVGYAANVTTLEGGAVSGDILDIKASSADAYPVIKLTGAAGMGFYHAVGQGFQFFEGTDYYMIIRESGDAKIASLANRNIFLEPNGTGYVKFGTVVGTGDVVCDGHVLIKDAAGNLVKLMKTA